MPFQPFTHGEVSTILQLSEGTTVAGQHEGHAGARHVTISNAGLNARLLKSPPQGGKLALFTSFLRRDDMVQALLAVLNGADQQAKMAEFADVTRPGGKLEIAHAAVPAPTRMRYAIGDSAQTFPCTHFTLVGRKDMSRPRQLHVVSFYGTMGKFYGEP